MDLKLLAFDAEDLAVISAHLQDATVACADMAYLPQEKRFALVCMRQDHVGGGAARPCGLHFNFVRKVQRLRVPQEETPQALTLIGVGFEETSAPSGRVTLLFNGGCAIRLDVDCIDATMRDLAPAPAEG
ncbi:MAG: hypothetical protein BGP06_04265 [Rhizobiales bacterium 65-9]|nr:DUF2948 family protein [Hyphomicrobiales bacterium]OJY36114.1 MAG: hypothetical protein BGP06_04265 [Rhizobiales bacterium 65-9]